jgi:hypothetical protein
MGSGDARFARSGTNGQLDPRPGTYLADICLGRDPQSRITGYPARIAANVAVSPAAPQVVAYSEAPR